ncbi:MAG: UvrD-helicase domain-containing protein [Betaproteobacteria bacterium]
MSGDADAVVNGVGLAAADAHARERAIDVHASWLVQAPAGSGKTELLVQRMLALLAHVEAPERVVATTFTIKAAAEMRTRVMTALTDARDGVETASPHRALTQALARAVLGRDQQMGWRLLEYPGRLDVGTLDALAMRIAAQAPVSSATGSAPGVVDNARALYRAAAQHAIEAAPAADPAWQTLIMHFDNDGNRVVELLASMLDKRDQWLPPLLSLRGAESREALERTLADEVERALADLCARWPRDCLDELVPLARHAHAASADDATLAELLARNDLPAPETGALAHWRGVANWLLTREGGFRKSPAGFPPVGKTEGAQHRRAMKLRAEAWLETLAQVPGLALALHRARGLPDPAYSPRARAFIDALIEVLPRVAAQLVVEFGIENACDFNEVTMRALQALGTADEPSPVLLAQDLRIEHLLIDEFQDTSQRQLQLIEKLTAGWQPGDGRTLFVVGDPMQSIYAFREADVRNFLDAAANGRIGGVKVGALSLKRNFRSQANLVAHVNATFPQVLAAVATRTSTAVGFGAAVAAVPATADLPTFELALDTLDEAARVVAHVQRALADGLADIAILVRARSHVDEVLRALRDAGIAYDAVKLDALAERPLSRDLLWLARALSQPADTLATMSVLRAPWCGLALPDLLVVAEASLARAPGLVVHDRSIDARLSDDGARRLRALADVFARVSGTRELPLATRTRAAWFALGGPACYGSDPSNIVAADAMLALIARHDRGGDIDDWDAMQDEAADLKADAPAVGDSKVKVMTLHAAKGLEFDAIVLPGLARWARGGTSTLLRWRARQGDRALLIGTPRARDEESPDPIDAWLKTLEDDDAAAELARLLYVGFTRARRRLHMTAVGVAAADPKSGEVQWKAPRRNTSLAMLWHALAATANTPLIEPGTGGNAGGEAAPPLCRLPAGHRGIDTPDDLESLRLPDVAGTALIYDWAQADAAAIGTVVHRMLARIASDGVDTVALARLRPRIEAELASLGVVRGDKADDDDAVARVIDAITNTLADPLGRWLFDPTHVDAASEWALTTVADTGTQRIAIDRTFIADGVRWIVDFKTSRHEGSDVDAFLDSERSRHAEQLERYARALSAMDGRPIMLALYFPALARLHAWPFAAAPSEVSEFPL